MTVDHDLPVPPYRQLAAILRQRIADGELTGRLPGERYMAADFGVAIGTVRKALHILRGEGLIETVQGWGTYVQGYRPPGEGGAGF
ncbi:MAG TPA: winged helix-turn-helix domain-containing protein [Streptosporangiaceae bacterium]|nr:winged helix-turn-helix domain-containing protein [Streptosporangiaceae bacterium]